MIVDQLDMFAILEPPPPVKPMSGTRWEALAVRDRGELTEPVIDASSSGHSLCTMGKVLRPFRFRGQDWVQTGACYYRGNSDRECYRIVAVAEFAGPGEARTYHDHDFHGANRAQFGGYHGMQAKHRGTDVVLIGPPIVLVIKAQKPERLAA